MIENIPCPCCAGLGSDPLDFDWGMTTAADCPCCKGKKTTTVEHAFSFISDFRGKVVVLQDELDEVKASLQHARATIATAAKGLVELKALVKQLPTP